MIGALPETLTVAGVEYSIRSDYRNVLHVFEAYADPEMTQEEKWIVTMYLLLEPFTCDDDVLEAVENGFNVDEAVKQIIWFISAGKMQEDKKEELPVYDWIQDEQMIFSAINDKAKCVEVREEEYLHWWTFLGYFNEIDRNSMLAFVMRIRSKRNKSNKLEKYEREFYNKNKDLVDIKKPMSKEEREAEEAYKAKIKRVLKI